MCNSMHIESQQRWSKRAICRDKPPPARLAGHGAGQECRKPGVRFSTVKVLSSDSRYSGYFSERALTSNMTPSEVLETQTPLSQDRHHADAVRTGTVSSMFILLWTSGKVPG